MLYFLRTTTDPENSQDRSKCREHLLKGIADFVDRAAARAAEPAPDIFLCAYKIFKVDQTNSVKQAALEPMKSVLRHKYARLEEEMKRRPSGEAMHDMITFLQRDFKIGKKATHTQTLKGGMLSLLGVWAESYPHVVHSDEHSAVSELKNMCMHTLEAQYSQWDRMVKHKGNPPDWLLMQGAIDLLKGLCTVHDRLTAKGVRLSFRVDVSELFKWCAFTIEQYTNRPGDYQRFHVLKAVLGFLGEHSSVLRGAFWPIVEEVLEWLLKIARFKTRDVRNLGWDALVAYVGSVAEFLLEDEDGGGSGDEKKREVCSRFVKKFLKILRENWQLDDDDDGDAGSEDRGSGVDTSLPMVIRALGQFAPAIVRFFGHEELRNVLQELIEYAQVTFMDPSEKGDKNSVPRDIQSHLADIMYALARIIRELPEIDETVRKHVDTVVVDKLVGLFPKMAEARKRENCKALWALLRGVDKVDFHVSEAVMRAMAEEAVELAVVRRESTEVEGGKIIDLTFMEDYIELFQELLGERSTGMNSSTLPHAEKKRQVKLTGYVYDGLVRTILNRLDSLDLSFVTGDDGDGDEAADPDAVGPTPAPAADQQVGDDAVEQRPNAQQDYDRYLSYVDFCVNLLPGLTPELFCNWALEYTTRIARLCEKDEHAHRISGHYKLMRIAFQLCAHGEERREGFFDTPASSGVDTREACKAEFLTFIERASTRMTQFTDELLVSAVESVVSVPLSLLDRCIDLLVQPMRSGLKLGMSHTPLAESAISRLEGWLEHSKGSLVINSALEKVLPALDDYLRVSAEQGQLTAEEVEVVERGREARAKGAPTRASDDTQADLCRRVLQFLGRFGGHTMAMVGTGSADELANDIAWDTTPRVQLEIPFPISDKPKVWLDKLLPRVIELAEGSNDRGTKVVAGELLHALILHYVATRSGVADGGKSSKAMYGHLLPAILRLSVDGEAVTCNLFEPLLTQLITWFTDPGNVSQGGAEPMLDAVADALCDPSNSPLRDAAAQKLAAFLKWAIKQHSARSKDGAAKLHVGNLFGRLFHLAVHPDPYKRIGASLALKQIKQEILGSPNLCEKYLFQFMQHFLTSLKLSDKDDEALEAATMAKMSIKYLTRIFKHNQRNDLDWEAHPTSGLRACVQRTFEGTAASERAYRDACTELFVLLATFVDSRSGGGRHTVKSYLQSHPENEAVKYLDGYSWATDRMTALYEGVNGERVATIRKWDREPARTSCLRILRLISTCACGYSNIIEGRRIAKAEEVLSGRSRFMPQLEDWIGTFADCADLRGSVADGWGLVLAADRIPVHCQREFAQTLLDVFAFVYHVLKDGSIARPENFLQRPDRWTALLLMCTINPKRMCFANLKQQELLRDALEKLLSVLAKVEHANVQSPTVIVKTLYQMLAKDKGSYMAVKLHKFDLGDKDDYANLLPVIMNHGVLLRSMQKLGTFFKAFGRKVFSLRGGQSSSDKTAITIEPSASTSDITISKAVLQFCLDASVELDDMRDAMVDPEPAERGERRTRGEAFCGRYHELLQDHVLNIRTKGDRGTSWGLDEYLQLLCSSAEEYPHLYDVLNSLIQECGPEQKGHILEAVVRHFGTTDQSSASADLSSPKLMQLVDTLVKHQQMKAVTDSSRLMRAFLGALDVRKNSLSVVESALTVVPGILGHLGPGHSHTAAIIAKLKTVCAEKITCVAEPRDLLSPGKMKELAEYVSLLDRLLNMVKLCWGMEILTIFYPLLTQPDHFHADAIQSALKGFAVYNVADTGQVVALFNRCWHEVHDPELPFTLRCSIMDNVCSPLLAKMDAEDAKDAVRECLDGAKQSICDMAQPPTLPDVQHAALAFSFFRAAYHRLAVSSEGGSSGLDYGSAGGPDKALLNALCKQAHVAFKRQFADRPPGESTEIFEDSLTQYHLRAFNCLAESLELTQRKASVFDNFVLDFGKLSAMWDKIVSIKVLEPFTAETEFHKANHRIGELREEHNAPAASQRVGGRLSSQYVAGESLAQEADFTQDSQVPSQGDTQAGMDSSQPSSSPTKIYVDVERNVTNVDPEKNTEMDPLNSNPCMELVMRIVHRRFSMPDSGDQTPRWIESLLNEVQRLAKEMTGRFGKNEQVLLYMLKIIINTPKQFAKYARAFVDPMVQVATTDGGNGGEGIHYFVRDICCIILTWLGMGDSGSDEGLGRDCVRSISPLVNHLMRNVLAHNLGKGSQWRQIFIGNLNLLDDFMAWFKPKSTEGAYVQRLEVSAHIILDFLVAVDQRYAAAGVQLLAMCLRYEVTLNVHGGVGEQELYPAVVKLLEHKSKSVHVPAAELLATALHIGKASGGARGMAWDRTEGSPCRTMMVRILHFWKPGKGQDHDRFIMCVYKISLGGRKKEEGGRITTIGWPLIVNTFRSKILGSLPALHDEERVRALQILTLDADRYDDRTKAEKAVNLLLELRPWINAFLRKRHYPTQLTALRLLRVAVAHLQASDEPSAEAREQMAHVLPTLCQTFTEHRKSNAREVFYSILILLWETFPERDGKDALDTQRPAVRRALLHGMADEAETIRVMVNKFWNESRRLSEEPFKRVPQTLTEVYHPDAEERWPGIACSLLLQLCERSHSWSESPHSTVNPGARTADVDVSKWMSRNNVFTTPLYQSQDAILTSGSQSMLPTGMVEATQDMEVDLSQTFAGQSGDELQASLAEDTAMDLGDDRTRITTAAKRDSEGFARPAPRGPTQAGSVTELMSTGFVRFNKKRRNQGGGQFQLAAERKRKRAANDQAASSTKRVRMLRRYRQGERPDFAGLTWNDIISPLRNLALKDRMFSRLLMDTFFAEVTDRQYVKQIFSSPSDAKQYTTSIVDGLVLMLQSTKGSPTLVGWLLGTFERLSWRELGHNTVGVSTQQIVSRLGQVSLNSRCYHGGIKALEALEMSRKWTARQRRDQRESGATLSHQGTLATHGTLTTSAAGSVGASASSSDLSEGSQELMLQLGSIYRALGDEDTAIGTWNKSAASAAASDAAKIMAEALRLDISAEPELAKEKYQEAQTAGADARICSDGLHACSKRLQQWSDITQTASDELQMALESSRPDQPILNCQGLGRFVLGFLKDPEQKMDTELLTNETVVRTLDATEPLWAAMLALRNGDAAKAAVNVDAYYTRFTGEWTSYHRLASKVRSQSLRGLQTAVEMEDTMKCYALLNGADAEEAGNAVKRLLRSWQERLPQRSEPTDVWANLLTYRQMNLRTLQKRVTERASLAHGWDAIGKRIAAAERTWCRDVAEIAAGRAEESLSNFHRRNVGQAPLVAAMLFVRREELNTKHSVAEKLTEYSKGLRAICARFESEDEHYVRAGGKAHLLKAEVCAAMANAICDIESDRRWASSVTWAADCETTHSDKQWQMRQALGAFKAAESDMREKQSADLSQLRCKCAEFCRQILPHCSRKDDVANIMVRALLRAMVDGSSEARMSLPSVLTTLAEYPASCATFAKYAAPVPTWMFLPWSRQMISRINRVRPESEVLVQVLTRLAEEFPQSTFYPFSLSFESFDGDAQRKAASVREKLRRDPAYPYLKKFVRGVSLLTDPWSRAYAWLDEIDIACQNNNVHECQQLVRGMVKDCFTRERGAGAFNSQFAANEMSFFSDVVKGITSMANAAASAHGDDVLTVLRQASKHKKRLDQRTKEWKKNGGKQRDKTKDAKHYSLFLHDDLKDLPADHAIELPGLWDGFSRPDLSQRVTLLGLDRTMLPLSSLRAPKKVDFYGSDDKEYPFLAKGGEDMRLDERLEQLFAVMNAQLRQDAEAKARQLQIRTFGVIPVTMRAGLCRWCPNTDTLQSVMNTECREMFAKYQRVRESRTMGHDPWTRGWERLAQTRQGTYQYDQRNGGNLLEIGNVSKVGINVFEAKFNEHSERGQEGFAKYLLKQPASKADELFSTAVKETPRGLLKERLLKLAPSAEAYLQLRANCAKTFSTFNTAAYIAGVGDRHTGNFLLDHTDGSIVGIDFGYSFGVPLVLPIPELTPFRLSPQLLQCFDPLDGKGYVTQMMVHTMRVLRKNQHVLGSIMRIFLDEPLLDWRKNAHMQNRGAENQQSSEEFGQAQIDSISRKLRGENPMQILLTGLRQTKHAKDEETWSMHQDAVKGAARSRRRKDDVQHSQKLSVQDQVEVLVDMATDGGICGRQWHGGSLWV